MMGNWSGGGHGSGYTMMGGSGYGTGLSWFSILSGILSFVLIGAGVALLIYFVGKSMHQNKTGDMFIKPHSASSLSDSELEEELQKRQSQASLKAEVANLKQQLWELQASEKKEEK